MPATTFPMGPVGCLAVSCYLGAGVVPALLTHTYAAGAGGGCSISGAVPHQTPRATRTPSRCPAGWVKRPKPGDGPDSIGGVLAGLMSEGGYFAAGRAAEIDALARVQAARDDAKRCRAYRAACNVWPRYAGADLCEVEYARRRLGDRDFARYLAVRGELASLLGSPGTLVLCGPNGPGKTHLASALVHAFCDAGRPAYYCTAMDFFTALRSTFGAPGRTAEEVVRRFRGYPLLVIDEVEVRSDSAWENNALRDLVNARYGLVLSTVLITNKTEDEINGTNGQPAYFGPALRDRIRQEGAVLVCDWPSLRGPELVKG